MTKLLTIAALALVLTGCGATPGSTMASKLRTSPSASAPTAPSALSLEAQIARVLQTRFTGARVQVFDIEEVAPGVFSFGASVVTANRAGMTSLAGEYETVTRSVRVTEERLETR
jgi:hypothetical protein